MKASDFVVLSINAESLVFLKKKKNRKEIVFIKSVLLKENGYSRARKSL
jgi:hypothetical protein